MAKDFEEDEEFYNSVDSPGGADSDDFADYEPETDDDEEEV